MALDPADIATVSHLLDAGLARSPAEREAWLNALPPEQQRHAATLRQMLAAHEAARADARLDTLPRLGPAPDEAIATAGERVGAYGLIREIGRGGMGSVWLAERADGNFKRQVALKLPRLAWGAGLAERMAREREIGALLEHPNIARLYDAGVDERGRPFMALEYIDGQPIDAWCEAQGLSVAARLRLFVQVARAVAYAHGRLVVHRDLKPSNVMVTADGQAHLLDFGIAKLLHEAGDGAPGLTQSHERVMTPHYAAPEQVAGEAITVQTDVYALGVLLYELLTGVRPIESRRASLGAVEDAILQGDAPAASSRVKDKTVARALRGDVDAILGKAMKREPLQRYASADALAEDIERHLAGDTVKAQPDSAGYRLRKAIVRHRFGFAAGAAVLVAVLVGGGLTLLQAQRTATQAERARLATAFVSEVFRVNAQASQRPADANQSTARYLDQGAQLIQARFSNEPDLQAQLFATVGQIYIDIGANKLAVDYASRQLQSLGRLPVDRLRQARATLLMADALAREERIADAAKYAEQAMTLAASDDALWLEATAMLGNSQLDVGRAEQAVKLTDLVGIIGSRSRTPSSGLAQALGLQARLLQRENRFEDAKAVFERAIAVAIQVEGTQSRTAIDLRLRAAYALADNWQGTEARPFLQAALDALRARGGADVMRAAIEDATLWVRMFAFGQASFSDAQAALSRSDETLAAHPQFATPVVHAHLDFARGFMYQAWSDYSRAQRYLDASVPILLASSDSVDLRQKLLRGQALVAGNIGQYRRADALWRQVIDLERRSGRTQLLRSVRTLVSAAEVLGWASEYDQAESLLREADRMATTDRTRLLVTLQRHSLAIGRGDLAGAKAALPAWSDNRYTKLTYGEWWCLTDRPREGLPLILAFIRRDAETVIESAPEVAQLRATAGLCALAIGDHALALELAEKARQAFTAQPEVSPYFKAPLAKLEQALRGRRATT